MANWSDPRTTAAYHATAADARAGAYDAGLRSYMLSVYNYMASGVLLTGLVAMLFAWGNPVEASPAYQLFAHGGILKWVVVLAPLGIVFAMSFGHQRMSKGVLELLYWAYALFMGLSLSTVFLTYTGGSIAQAFFATAAGFAGLSLFGYTTKKDLSAWGSFLIVGLVGLIVASLLNLFFQSGTLDLVISAVGVLLFAGLTAYDTQKIKSIYVHVAGTDMEKRVAIMGALNLYLDFINMFLFLLRLFGNQRN